MKFAHLVSGLMVLAAASAASAAAVTFVGVSGDRAGEARFDTSGSNLIVTLTNTSSADVLDPPDVLQAIFFNSATPLTLTPVQAQIAPGSVAVYGTADASGLVGGEFGYGDSLTKTPGNLPYGISSAGYGMTWTIFQDGTLLQPTGGVAPDGPTGGLLSAGDNTATGNGGVTGNTMIKNSVVFTLSGLPAGFDPLRSITSVFFQYGTALDDGGFGTGGGDPPPPALPLPPAVWGGMSVLGMLGIGRLWKRRMA